MTIGDVARPRRTDDLDVSLRDLRRARAWRRTFLVAVAVVVLAGVAGVFGPRTSTTEATDDGWTITVEHVATSRSGLPAPFTITVRHADAFDEPVTLLVDAAYLALFDENGLDPDPISSTTDERNVVWTFSPPADGHTLVISLDARIEPGRFGRFRGSVALADTGRGPRVQFTTWLAP